MDNSRKPELWRQIPSIWFDFQSIYDEAVASAPPGSSLVEVGSFWGQSAVYLAEAAKLSGKGLKVYCVDLWAMTPANNPSLFDLSKTGAVEPPVHARHHNSLFETFAHFVDASGLSPDPLRILRMASLEAADLLESERGNIHFVFLDGDHNYEYVIRELAAWERLLGPKGWLAGHDYTQEFCGVIRATREYYKSEWGWPEIEIRGSSWIGREAARATGPMPTGRDKDR
jgi:hypothetical protein